MKLKVVTIGILRWMVRSYINSFNTLCLAIFIQRDMVIGPKVAARLKTRTVK